MPTKRHKDNDKDNDKESRSDQSRPTKNPMRGAESGGMRGSAMHATPGMTGMPAMPGGGKGNGHPSKAPTAMTSHPGPAPQMQTGGAGSGAGGAGGPGEPEPPRRRTCGAMDVHRRLLSESAEYRAARAAIENITLERLTQPSESRFAGVVRIPVVVHVVSNTAAQNI